MGRRLIAFLLAGTSVLPVAAQSLTPGQQRYRALFQELVETNTQLSNGNCTTLAQKIAGHLKEAGLPDSDIRVFTAPDHPNEGGIVAVLPGSDRNTQAVLLLGHLDVVEARREDWTRDPYKLVEENGYFYGRGVSDMKSLVAAWVDTMMRLKQEDFQHPRALKMALTCGEETASAFNGAGWLATHERALIDAEFALNEGGGGRPIDGIRRGRRLTEDGLCDLGLRPCDLGLRPSPDLLPPTAPGSAECRHPEPERVRVGRGAHRDERHCHGWSHRVAIAPGDLWFWPTGILDPQTGQIERPRPNNTDMFAGWDTDGNL